MNQNNKSLYYIGILCLIPLFGALLGIILILLGIFRYKDKWLIIIGTIGILITLFAYLSMFYFIKYSDLNAKGSAKLSQEEINNLAKRIEFYKFQTGVYPDNLERLRSFDNTSIIYDPILLRKMDDKINTTFIYNKIRDHYKLFSVGIDGIPNTSDDIYPNTSDTTVGNNSGLRQK